MIKIAFENIESKRKITFIILIFLALLMFFSFLTSGVSGLFGILKIFFYLILVAIFIGVIFYIVYYLFFMKHKTDVNYMNYMNIVSSAKLSRPPLLNDLYLRGDKEHMSARLGKIEGYARLENIKTKEQEDVFVVQNATFPFSLFSEPKVIRVKATDHSNLVGDVYIHGISLIKLGSFFYLNNAMTDAKSIDEAQKLEGMRILSHQTLADMKGLIDIATGIDSEHKKQIEGKSLMTLPQGSQKQE